MNLKRTALTLLFAAFLCFGGFAVKVYHAFGAADEAVEGGPDEVAVHMKAAMSLQKMGFLLALTGTGVFFYSNRRK
ncbi:MAG: hypothetical protein ACSHX8_13845 [Opitutaceae bacterium]